MSRHVTAIAGRALLPRARAAAITPSAVTPLVVLLSRPPPSFVSALYTTNGAWVRSSPTTTRHVATPDIARSIAHSAGGRGLWPALHTPFAGRRLLWRTGHGQRPPPGRSPRRFLSDGKESRRQTIPPAQTSRRQALRPSGSSEAKHGAGKHLIDRLPHLPHIHRPTKEELLAAATGFWQRLTIRFKWFSIRSVRPFNSDEIGAFISWILWGHVLWIVIGTTTFVSLAIWFVNTVFAQETLAGWVGTYLTQSSGVKVVFESAIVPTWRDGVITFNNVFVSRRPGAHGDQEEKSKKNKKKQRTVSKGSSTTAAAAAAEAVLAEKTRDPADAVDDGNYTQFDVTIDTVNVTLSFTRWFNGRGLLRDVEVRGVRGVVDRTSVRPTGHVRDPKSYRHQHTVGDFEIESFRMEDVLLTVYQPNGFRPFTASVFTCELPRLRKQWLFYDFMSANNMSGSFDDSLFTIHPRQVHGTTGAALVDGRENGEGGQWKKHTRLRIDGLNIDHLNRGVQGPFGWIHEGNVDIVADVMLPNDDPGSIAQVMADFYDRMEATVTATAAAHATRADATLRNDAAQEHQNISHRPHAAAVSSIAHQPAANASSNRVVAFDILIHLNDVRAHVPLFTQDLSYINNALVRPIVAYINSRRAFIPVTCRVVKRLEEFDGSWTIFDSGLLDDLSRETYNAFVRDIMDARRRKERVRKVAGWGIQVVAQALFLGLAGQLA